MAVTNYYTANGEIIGEKTAGGSQVDYLTDALGSFINVVMSGMFKASLFIIAFAQIAGCVRHREGDYVITAGVPIRELNRVVRVLESHRIKCHIEATTGPAGIYVWPEDLGEAVRLINIDARDRKYELAPLPPNARL